MNFKQVEAFRAVMMTRSMTTAAGLLHTSQPNVSRWIALLETRVGFPLFERSGTRLIPTSEAMAFYADVERAFIGLESLNASADSIRRRGSGFIRVGAIGSITHCVMPDAIRMFRQTYPDIPVVINTGSSDAVAKWVATGFCDIGFCSIPTDLPSLHCELINTAYGVGLVSRSHRLAELKVLTPSDFHDENFISLPPGNLFREAIDRHFRDVTRVLSIETPYVVTICTMVGKGLGVSIVNPVVSRALQITGICEIPFSEKVEFNNYVVTSDYFPAGLLARRMTYFVKDVIEALNASTSPRCE